MFYSDGTRTVTQQVANNSKHQEIFSSHAVKKYSPIIGISKRFLDMQCPTGFCSPYHLSIIIVRTMIMVLYS